MSDVKKKILTICNHKGGVGKTTLTLNLMNYLMDYYNHITIIDFDSQANTSNKFTMYDSESYMETVKKNPDIMPRQTSIADVIEYAMDHNIYDPQDYRKFKDIVNSATTTITKNEKTVDLVKSSLSLDNTRKMMTMNVNKSIKKVREVVNEITKDSELVIFDTAPSIDLLTFTAIALSNFYIIPVTMDVNAIDGADDIINDIAEEVREFFNPHVALLGLVVNSYSPRQVLDRNALEILEMKFKDKLFKTKLHKTVRYSETMTLGISIRDMYPNSKHDKNFASFTKELVDRMNNTATVNVEQLE